MTIDTLCVQGGWQPKRGEPRQPPIVQSTTFRYETTQQMADLFDLKASGYFYTRLANPTNDAVAGKIAALEGGVAAILTSSGQAASMFAVMNIAEAGDHVVASAQIYGGTFNLLAVSLKKLGIESLRVYGTITNPFVVAKSSLLKDYDPEMAGSLDYPLTKQMVFGVNMTF